MTGTNDDAFKTAFKKARGTVPSDIDLSIDGAEVPRQNLDAGRETPQDNPLTQSSKPSTRRSSSSTNRSTTRTR